MRTLVYTLVADGSSDEALVPIINWTLEKHCSDINILGQFATGLKKGRSLAERLQQAVEDFPCEILFIHRDAESMSTAARRREITDAAAGISQRWVPIVPQRMTEAWLLSDETALRIAAGNKAGRVELKIPPLKRWENLPDPKQVLIDALKTATEKSGRQLDKFNPWLARSLVTPKTRDFSQLCELPSFVQFENDVIALIDLINNL